jgi:hypothetical protein
MAGFLIRFETRRRCSIIEIAWEAHAAIKQPALPAETVRITSANATSTKIRSLEAEWTAKEAGYRRAVKNPFQEITIFSM